MPIVLRILERHGLSLAISDSVRLGGAAFVISKQTTTSESSGSTSELGSNLPEIERFGVRLLEGKMGCSSFLLECLRPAALLVGVVASMLVPYGVAEAALEQGFLDLSAWNAEEEPTLRLDGTWYFFDNELLSAKEAVERLAGADTFTEVPSVWTSDFKVLDDRGLGVATYALRLRLPTEQSVWFETYGFQTAGRLFVADLDGNVLAVGESGEVGRSADSELAINWYPNELGFERDRASSDDVILVAQISNFSYPNGGFQKSLYIQTFSRGKRASLFKIVLTSLTLRHHGHHRPLPPLTLFPATGRSAYLLTLRGSVCPLRCVRRS